VASASVAGPPKPLRGGDSARGFHLQAEAVLSIGPEMLASILAGPHQRRGASAYARKITPPASA
jgi:hypothetical protein